METSEYDKKVIELMHELVKTENADHQKTRELFNLYNEKFKPRETGMHCSSCRARVFSRMKEYYNNIKTKDK